MSEDLTKKSNEQLMDQVEALLEAAADMEDQVGTLEAENKSLKSKVAGLEEEKVTLQKVASQKPEFKFNESLVSDTVQTLKDLNLLEKESSENLEKLLDSDPNNVLTFLSKVAMELSQFEATSQGRGIKYDQFSTRTKSANDQFESWLKACKEEQKNNIRS